MSRHRSVEGEPLPDEAVQQEISNMSARLKTDDEGFCSWGSCTTPSAARVRCRNVLGLPTTEAYWMCEEHARRMVENCPRGDFIDARKAVQQRDQGRGH